MQPVRAFLSCSTLLALPATAALEPHSRALAQPDAPVAIVAYEAAATAPQLARPGRATRGGDEVTVQHALEYRNAGERTIAAVRLGVIAFDLWKEEQEGIYAVELGALAPGESRRTAWTTEQGRLPFATGVAFVDKVRFEGGEVWAANRDELLDELLAAGFEIRRLEFRQALPEGWVVPPEERRREGPPRPTRPRGEPPSLFDDDPGG